MFVWVCVQEESEKKKANLQQLDSDLAMVSPSPPLSPSVTNWWVWPETGVADKAEAGEGCSSAGQPEIETDRRAALPHRAPQRL